MLKVEIVFNCIVMIELWNLYRIFDGYFCISLHTKFSKGWGTCWSGQVNTTVTNYQSMTNILFEKFRIPELWPHLVEISPPTSGNIFYASVSYQQLWLQRWQHRRPRWCRTYKCWCWDPYLQYRFWIVFLINASLTFLSFLIKYDCYRECLIWVDENLFDCQYSQSPVSDNHTRPPTIESWGSVLLREDRNTRETWTRQNLSFK